MSYKQEQRAVKVLLSTLVLVCLVDAQLTTNLTMSVFISGINGDSSGVFIGGLDGRQFQAAVDVAVEAINNHTELLSGYNLGVQYVDSQCSAGPSVRGFIEHIFDVSERILIIGSDCSTATEPVAELAPFWGLTQISPLSSSPSLSEFEQFVRLVPSDVAAVEGVVSLMQMFNWTRLGVISQQETIFTSNQRELSNRLREFNSTLTPITFNTGDDPTSFVTDLSMSPLRIIFLNVYPSYAIEILCLAHRFRMTFAQGYLWLLYPWYPDEWWTQSPDSTSRTPVTCAPANIERVLDRSIIIDYLPLPSNEGQDDVTAAGISRAEYMSLWQQRLEEAYRGADVSLSSQALLYFDAVLMGALALNATNDLYNLSLFNYDTTDVVSANITRLTLEFAQNLDFLGVSGPISLEGKIERKPTIRFLQYRQNSALAKVLIGNLTHFDPTNLVFPLPAGVPMDEREVYISLPLFVVYTILSCVGILFAAGVGVFLVVFRRRTSIRNSSPYINMLIIAGAILFYVDVIMFGIDEGTAPSCTVNALCMTRIWIACIAFSLMFGTIFVKTWRVYYAFLSGNRGKKKKTMIAPDWLLFTVVGVLVVMDVVYLVIVTAVDDARLVLTKQEIPSNTRNLPIIIGLCTAPDAGIWIIIQLVFKGLLLIVGLFLAFETRQVKIKRLRDSKTIGMSVYVVAILSLASAIIGVLLMMMVDVFYAVVGVFILVCCTTVLCLILIPSVYRLWKDPEGLRALASPDPQVLSETFDTIVGLNNEVEQLKSELQRLSKLVPEENHAFDPVNNCVKMEDSNGASVTVLNDKKSVQFVQN